MKIGVFDSGLGGLVITRSFINTLPEYDYVYYGDTKHLPYGEKTSGRILNYTLEAVKFLIAQDCALIIIACNTATSIALRYIQQRFIPAYAPSVKVLGVVIPTVEKALETHAAGVGVIATNATVRSHIYRTELHKICPELAVREIAAPQLVPAIEGNDFAAAERLAKEYAAQFDSVDGLILGCTHYPFLSNVLKRELGSGTELIDPSAAVARELKHQLSKRGLLSDGAKGKEVFYISGDAEKHRAVIERLWNSEEALDLRSVPPATKATLS